ncbi:hypothetical protein WJX74_008569 [Apatococcus lobatus]|uniref:HECT-type E3 ubiquitin transferase n=1 Tax=Apatococcus lobatus TaxID=904363 RepID=A0AAW1RL12_9CHLO
MKVKVKKSLEVPPEIKAFTDKALSTPFEQLGQLFAGFQFNYSKGDFHHWVPLFNYLDDYFEKGLQPRADLQLDVANGLQARVPFPVANVNAVLQFTATVLENCSNKHLYGSHDHLGSLLAAPHTSVVLNALQTLVAFVRKTHSSSSRLQASAGINNRLLALCHGWGGKEQGLGLLACASQTQDAVEQGHSQATTLRYVFHDASRPGSASGSQPQQGAAPGNSVELRNLHRFSEDDFQILTAITRGHELSMDERFVLLCKIRTTRLFGSLEGRQALVSIRLLAFYVLVQSSPSQEEVASFFSNEPEFVGELVSLLQAEKEVPEPIRVLALRSLAVQLMERSRHASVISTISAGGQSGLLSLMMHRSVAALVRPHQVPDRYSLSFVEALLSLIGALVASTTGCSALAEAGLVPALLPLIKDMDPDHVRLVSSCIHILETFMDYSPNAASLFRDLGGLDDMIFRLRAEIGLSTDPSSSQEARHAMQDTSDTPEASTSPAANASTAAVVGEPSEAPQAMQIANDGPEATTSAAADASAAAPAEPPPVPYHRRVLLKSLLRAIALASYAPGTATRPDEAESRALYQCLRAIFERATEFGGGLFALAASVMTDLIHHDPLCFRELDAAGLPDAFIAAIKAGVIPSGEAVCSVPNTLVAICLNTGGLTKVSESGALDCFIPILTSKTYLKALQGDTPSVLGAGLDELLRHVTSLRKNGVSMILQVFRTLCAEGGTEIAPQPLPEEGDQSMETEGGASAAEGAAPAAEGTAMDVEASEAGQQAAETAAQAASPDQPALQPASPSGDVDMTGPSQEGDAAASRTQQPGAPAEQPAPAVSAGPSAPEPPSALPQQDVESPDHLPECISHAARMLDNMSANAETSRLFIQQGGIELLLALYRLPRLPPTFGSSSAAHALTATFRTLTMQHAQPLSKHLSSVLNQQLDQALQSAKEIGDQNVPTMPAKERDAYIRLISSTEGLICLAAAVARNAQHMLLEVSAGATSIITRIGEVERVVLWQACHSSHPPADEQFQTFGALAEEERAEELQQQAGQGPMGLQLHNNADPQGLTTAAPGNGHILPAPAAIAEALAAGGDADMASAAAEPRDGLVDASEPASPGDRQDEEGQQTGRARRKTQQALAYEVLVHFTIQIRAFYTAVAKAIQTPVRRREELGTSPTMAMRAAAINMAVVLRQNMRYKMLPAPPNVVFGSDLINKKHPRTAVLRQLNYTTRLLEEMMMVLVDGRRRTCHTLVLNYLVVGHGFTTFLDHFKLVLAWMWTMKESLAPVKHLLKHVPADWIGVHPAATMVKLERMAATPEGVAKFNALPDLSEAHALNCFVNVLEAMTEGMLGGLEQLTHASMVLASPQADTLLVAPVPGAPPIPEGQPAPTAQAFVKQLQSSVLAAVMPIWGHYLLPTCCGPMCNMVVTTITSCLDSTLGPAHGAGGQPPPPAHAPPDAGLVQQITEMGFSQPRAEEALRRVGHNSVELAMEWLIAHPEDPAAAGGAADAAAAASAEGDEAQLAQALAASLKAGELSKNAAEEDAQSLKAMLTPIQLVRGAIAVMECVPDAAFGLSDLVANLCQRDDGKLRNQILEQILINLRGDQSIEMEVNSRSPTNLLAAAHLLALLLTEHNEVKKTTVAPGFVKCSLQLLTAQVDRLQTRDNPDGDIAIPSWVDALLLALHSMVQSTAKPSEPAAPSGNASAAGTGPSGQQGPVGTAAGQGLVPPASAAAPSAAGAAAGSALQPLANGAADQGPATQPGNLLDSMRDSLVKTLEEQHRPGGLLSPEQQDLAAMICIRLLQHVQSRGPDYQRTMSETYHAGTEAAPKSTAHSCLQLLSRLTTRHEIALKVLREKGHRLALDLPVSALGPELEPYMTALMRHILEDPATLQAAMEAEIRSTLASQRNSPSGMPGQSGSAPLHSFLQTLTPVLARDPTIFVNAMAATCKLEEAQSNLLGSGRVMVTLKSPIKAAQPPAPAGPSGGEQGAQQPKTPLPAAQTPQPAGPPPDTGIVRRPSSLGGSNRGTPKAGERATPFKASAMKPGKKLVPASFAEVIDSLLDALQSYKDPAASQPEANQPDSQAGPSSMETDSPAQLTASNAPAVSPAENGNAGSAGPSAQAALAETAAAEEAKTKAKRKAANRIEQSRVRQCIFFKMLTEFTLKYGNCIGVLLKADTSASSSRDTAKTPVKAERSAGGTVFRQLMFTYLVGLPPGNAVAAAMAEHCSFFLLAVCIRSAEGRNRIVSEIVKTLRGDNAPELPTTSPPESLPFRDAPHQPSPMLLKPFVDLAGSLLQALQPSPNNRSLGPATGLFHEMILTMRKAGITKAIINSIRLIDMEHPGAAKMASDMLKPLEALTRSLPPRPPSRPQWPSTGPPPPGATSEARPAEPAATTAAQENGNVPAPAAHPGPESAAAAGAAGPSQGDAQMTEVEAEQESAAGPDALAAAEHAWAEQGRSDRGRGGRMPRSMDAMIEDILEQAYEEGMQAYDDHHLSEGESGSDGDDMSDDEDMHDDDDEASPSLESDHDHGESGEEDDDDGEDDDDDDEDGVSSDDSLSDHSFDHIDGGGDTDADAEATGQVVIRDEEQDLLRLGEEVARFTDADLGMDMGMGMREEDEEDEHMQGMGDDDDQGSEGEEEDEDEEVDEEDAITDDEAAFEDGDEPSIWDDHRVIGGRDEEDGDEMVAPRWAGMQRLPGTSNLHPAQVMQELLGNLTGQVATDRRRFRIISSRQGGRPQGPAPTMPAAAAPVQHRLLQRPTEDAEASAAARTDGVPLPVPVSYAFAQGMDGSGLRRLGGVNFPTEAAGPGGSVMVFQDPSLRGLAVGGQAARHPVAPGSMPPAAMADFAMDLLLGSGGPARASSMRTSSWSDDGQQAAGGNAGSTLAGTFERNIMEAFRARTAAQAPAEPAAATPAAAPATDASAAPAGTIASQLDGAAQGSDGNQPAGPSQPAAAGPSSTSMPPPAEPSAAAEATPSQPQQSAASADAPNSAEVSPAPASLPSLESSPADEDEEMMDAEEGGDEDAEAGGGEEVSSAMAEAAAAVGIDLAFLQALPAELRGEVLAAHGAEMPSEAPAAPAAPTDPQAAAAEAATQLAQAAAAAFGLSAAAGRPQPMEGQEASAQPLQPSRDVSVPNPATSAPADVPMESQPESEAAAAPSAAPHGDGQQPSTAAQPAAPAQPEQPPDEMDGIDPEFIAALPPDIQAEVLEQQRRERRRRAAERQRAAAAQAAAAAGNAGGQGAGGAAPGAIGPAEMDLATLLATFPPEVREEVLLSDDAVLSSLPPALLAEAQALRDRSMRFMSGMGRGLAGRHVHHIHELPIGRGGAQMGSSAMLSRALAGVGRGQAPNAPGDRSSAPSRQIAVGPPLVDEEDLSVLASLLYMPMTSKTQLQRVFSNAIINHSTTRSQALRILLAFLRSTSPPTPRFGEPAPAAFGMQALQVQSSTSEEGPELEVSPPMSRRTLELLVYLARHQPRLAREIPFQLVPGPPTEQIPVVEDKKGKGKAAEKPHIPEAKAMEVLLTLLGLPLFRRSNAHLEQALQLLDTTFHAAYTAILERKRIQEANAKLKKDKEAAAKKMEEERAQEAKAAETRSQDSQSEPAQPSASATEQVPQESYAAAGAQPPTAGTAAGDQQPVVVESRAGAQPAAGNGGTAEAGPLGSSAAASPTPQPEQSQPLPDDPAPVLESLPEQLVRRLPQLLGQRGCTELAYSKCTAAMMHLVHCAKRHKAIMLAELEADLLRISDGAVAELHRLAQSDLQDPALGVDVGTTGGLVKRVLQAVAGLMKPPKEHEAAQPAAATAVPAESAASAAEAAASGAGPSRSREQEVHDQGLVDRIAQRSSPLWVALSECIGRIEAGLKSPGGAGDTAATSRVLPPGAAQVLPLVEAFFVLCDARTAHLPPLPELSPARSLEQQLPSVPATPAGSAATPAQHPHGTPTAASAPVNEAHLPFLRFAEKHRKLLNTLLRVNSGLLEGSLKPLLKVPRLIDFDNKRSYFRSRARSTHHEERGHYGTLRINVRREHVFEDSFHQLRMKPPGEMRAKLSVQFHGEEGIDAGGVSREWYSVMAREIFNPNISLFIPLPEGGTTFQPNPNSIVQNDETRGTSHLDFFKFVGRIVGKALYDGQFIDAYFTRSFYKHMLMQPLTYQDIEAVDPEYFKNLAWMLENDITDILDLTFTEESDYFGKKELVELKPGGTTIKVTNANKREYVNLIAQHRMTTAIRGQINAFLTGFWDLIPKELISIFNDHELELLISGLPEIDVSDLRRNTEYSGYTAASKTIQWFWEVVQGLDKEDLALLVQFVTGTSKVPLDGFKALQGISGPQKFQIHKAYGPSARLPSAHTCFNQLDLLEYETQDQLKDRLLLALHEGAEGFGFG